MRNCISDCMISLYLASKDRPLFIGKVRVVDTFRLRMKGLLGTPLLPDFRGLLIKPCRQVHTVGMKYPISVWFINKDYQIIRLIDYLPPFRFSPYVRDASYVLEFPANWGGKMGCREGDFLEMVLK